MSLKSEGAPQRRRGRALEDALLEAAWTEVTDVGYDAFTFDSVAARAGTSRAVLYRRWAGKQELVHAAVEHAVSTDAPPGPDTGTLRGDVIAILTQTNRQRFRLAIHMFNHLGEFYRATGTTFADIAAATQRGRVSLVDQAIARAVARCEIAPGQVSARLARLPGDLFRNEVLMTMKPVSDATIEEIVDDVFLPLVHLGGQDRPAVDVT